VGTEKKNKKDMPYSEVKLPIINSPVGFLTILA
jgi:hypothetical protein